jgi:hypothetical protein
MISCTSWVEAAPREKSTAGIVAYPAARGLPACLLLLLLLLLQCC